MTGPAPNSPARRRWLGGTGLAIIAVVIVAVLVALGAGVWHASSSPQFCASCHIMGPYVAAWKSSSHASVPCVECHYPPGFRDTIRVKFQAVTQVAKWATGTYSSKPYAEVEDASCLRSGCHNRTALETAGPRAFKRGVRFAHGPHLTAAMMGRQLRCTSCHAQIVVDKHFEVSETTCFTCHFRGTKEGRELTPVAGCRGCHEVPTRDIVIGSVRFNHAEVVQRGVACQNCHLSVVEGQGDAPRERCLTCHNQPEKLARYGERTLIHAAHVTQRSVACTRCHTEIKHRLPPRMSAPGAAATRAVLTALRSSGAGAVAADGEPVVPRTAVSPPPGPPHDGQDLDCRTCHRGNHRGVVEMYVGMGGRGTPMIPSHMFQVRVECVACHTAPKTLDSARAIVGETFRPSELACVGCHGEKYRGMVQQWATTLARMREILAPKLAAAHAALGSGGADDSKRARARKLADDAEFNERFVALAKGVHNVFYAADLLKVANTSLDMALALLGKSTKIDDTLVRGGYCAVLCHEAAGVKQKPVVTFAGRPLPHVRHVTEFGATCTSCHSAETHKTVTATGATCQACHHSPQNDRCESCHRAQAAFYRGKTETSLAKMEPNVMAPVVGCTGCHDLSRKHSREAVAQKCLDCHDAQVAGLNAEWTKGFDADLGQTARAIHEAEVAVAPGRGPARTEAEAVLKDARRALALVTTARPVHNPAGAESLLKAARGKADEARTLVSR